MRFDKDIKSYNGLYYKKINKNYLVCLSIKILDRIENMKSLDDFYSEYKDLEIINDISNWLKDLLWTKFCCQIRDYSDTLYQLFKNKKYNEIKEYINNETKFIKFFVNNKDEYNALSISLHNLNSFTFNDDKLNKCFSKTYKDMNKALVNSTYDEIKNEFETVYL